MTVETLLKALQNAKPEAQIVIGDREIGGVLVDLFDANAKVVLTPVPKVRGPRKPKDETPKRATAA